MFEPLTRKFQTWRRRRQTLRRLHMLDDRLLADMGTCRDDLEAFISTRVD